VFAPEAIWKCPAIGLRFETRASFIEFLKPTSAYDLLIQTPHSPVVTITGSDRAHATTTIHELTKGVALTASALGEKKQEYNFEQYGIYFDKLARIEGEWRFTHRLFVPFYLDRDRVTGNLRTQRTELLRP
jgi:SnoaL-like domain